MKKNCFTPKTPRSKMANKDALQVYCRLRPMDSPRDVSCIKVLSSTQVQLTLPDSSVNFRPGCAKEFQCSFKRVFTESDSQKTTFDEVALPLVEQLVKGRNGLLFTYGVTGSGKTHTMTGTKKDVGIMPRCLDVLFNSISDFQAGKYIFKPDRMNGFEVQSEDDALRDREESMKSNAINKFVKLRRKESDDDLLPREKDETKLSLLDEDNAFAVFVTYIEIYNKLVYDLLEDISETDICAKLQQKIMREDASHNMYIHGVTEVEVKSAEEAFDVFYKGQKRKRMAHTTLNTESSRSHSVFTIRLVQAPLDMDGESVMQGKRHIRVSQLSLVDLAGSERTNRTKNCGQRLREAGDINNSLMTLRKCLETLRENQSSSGPGRPIPYRDSKLTQLFKNYFEGEGHIRMVVCVNPRVDDYDETVQVMKFAEVSQEIQVAKPTPLKTDLAVGLTPGRRKANQMFKKQLQLMEEEKEKEPPVVHIPNDVGVIFSFAEPFPSLEFSDPMDETININLIKFLEERKKKKERLAAELIIRGEKLRAALLEQEQKQLMKEHEVESLRATLEHENAKIKCLEQKFIALDSENSSLKRKTNDLYEENKRLKIDIDAKGTALQQYNANKDREKKRLNAKIAAKEEKFTKEIQQNVKELKTVEQKLRDKENRLRIARKILESDEQSEKVCSDFETASESEGSGGMAGVTALDPPVTKSIIVSPKKLATTIPISNVRYGKSQCEKHDQWLDHRSNACVPLNTVMQPVLKRRKSFEKVTSPKEVKKMSKYCLFTQSQDTEGVLETQLYKGDVVPTVGGGAQVILNDVETLKQSSPVTSPKQRYEEYNATVAASAGSSLYPDINSRCATSLEGHRRKT